MRTIRRAMEHWDASTHVRAHAYVTPTEPKPSKFTCTGCMLSIVLHTRQRQIDQSSVSREPCRFSLPAGGFRISSLFLVYSCFGIKFRYRCLWCWLSNSLQKLSSFFINRYWSKYLWRHGVWCAPKYFWKKISSFNEEKNVWKLKKKIE